MASIRKAPDDDTDASEDRPPSKRRCLRDDADAVGPASLESVNDDCLVLILSFLPTEDLNNNVAMCNKRFCGARSHESLDQTRTATINVLSQGLTTDELYTCISNSGWSASLQRNFTRLKITGLERLQRSPTITWLPALTQSKERLRLLDSQLNGVTSLQLTDIPDDPYGGFPDVWLLSVIFPNLREADLSSSKLANTHLTISSFRRLCHQLKRITWNGCSNSFHLDGREFQYNDRLIEEGNFERNDMMGSSLTEVQLDDTRFMIMSANAMRLFSDPNEALHYMFHRYSHLESLSIKNATCTIWDQDDAQPVSQAMLMKLARCHPTLRWLRSDLSAENIATLKRERPEITFIGE